MENKAHFVLIGVFVLLTVLAGVVFLAWISDTQFDQQYDEYEVVFTGPVRGLSRGSEVHYNGLQVGEVTMLRWDANDSNTVIADVRVVEGAPIHRDSEARLEPQGLTGLNYIQITSGISGELFSGRPPYRITGNMSQLDVFLADGGTLIEGSQRVLSRVNAALNTEAIEDFHGILDNINAVTTNLRDADIDPELVERVLVAFERAAIDVSAAAVAVDQAAVDFDALVGEEVKSLMARTEKSLDEVDVMVRNFAAFAEGGEQLTVDSRDAINRLSNSGLTDMEETVDALRRLVISLTEVAEKLEQNPQEFIAGEEREVMELPQ